MNVAAAKASASELSSSGISNVSLTGLNYFEFFSLPESFSVDLERLDREYRKLQAQYHPDRFAGAEDSQRLQALQHTSLINEAYETLKTPLKRAAYVLKLGGVNPEEHNQAHLQEAFLLEQLALREQLEACVDDDNLEGLDALKSKVKQQQHAALTDFEAKFEHGELADAKPVYNKLQFLFKLLDEIDTAEEKLLDY